MDLKSLMSVTRRALEAEARRWGVPEPQLRSRAELMRLIVQYATAAPFVASRKRISEGKAAIEQARESLEVARYVAVDLASEILPASLREAAKAKLRSRMASPDTPETPASALDYDVIEAAGEPYRTTPPAPAASNTPAPRAAGAAVAPPPPASFEPTEVGTEEVPEAGYTPGLDPFAISEPMRAVRARSLAPSAPGPRRFEAEPIRTLSMARLLASAGERERALAVYEELIARESGDPVLRREAEILRAGGDLRGLPMPEYTPTKVPRPRGDDAPPDDAHIRWERSESGEHITAHFDVSDSGIARAQAVLGQRGELTLRLVTIRPDVSKVVRSEVEDHALPGNEGAFEIGPVDPSARCLLSLGLRAGERFVSITHGTPQP